MNSVQFLERLLDIDYDFTITNENNMKVVSTKYGKFYMHTFNEVGLLDCIVHMRALQLNADR